jgi:hypothetical protein
LPFVEGGQHIIDGPRHDIRHGGSNAPQTEVLLLWGKLPADAFEFHEMYLAAGPDKAKLGDASADAHGFQLRDCADVPVLAGSWVKPNPTFEAVLPQQAGRGHVQFDSFGRIAGALRGLTFWPRANAIRGASLSSCAAFPPAAGKRRRKSRGAGEIFISTMEPFNVIF